MKMTIFIMPTILIILGVIIRSGKGTFLLSGNNSSIKKGKEKFDEKALYKFVSNLLFFCSAVILIYLIAKTYNYTAIKYVAMITLIITVMFASSYANTKNRFLKK